jgi:Rrf2 family transcriptional regulator, nitric oxide-sensitive transcriptional repressor
VRLTLHTDYGLRVLVYLATAPGRNVTTTEIGRAYGISKNHLVRVAHSLRNSGFIELTTGRSGGLALARAASSIRIGEVVRALEPELRMVECFDKSTNTCPIAPRCGLTGIIAESLTAFFSSLDRHTIGDVVTRSGPTLSSYFIPADSLTSKRAGKPTSKRAGKPTSKRAGKPTSKRAGEPASRRASRSTDRPTGEISGARPQPRRAVARRA